MNPITAHQISAIRLSEDEKDDRAITELIWFQLLAGAKPSQIEYNLIAYRQLRADASASRSHHEEQARMHHERELESRRWAEQREEMWKKTHLAYLKQIALAKSIKAAVATPTPTERGCCGFHTRSIVGRPGSGRGIRHG